MRKNLVLGGSGFVGRYFINRLLSNNQKVINYDMKSTNIKHKNYKFIKGDIQNIDLLKKYIVKNINIYHFAGWSDVENQPDEKKILRLNYYTTKNILQISATKNINKFIFASSMYVLSNKGGAYRKSKVLSENIIRDYAKKKNLDYLILRFGSVYGPGAKKGNAIFDILNSAIKKKVIKYWGTGDEIRQYIHASDASKIIYMINKRDKKLNKKTILLTGLEDTKITELFETIKEMLNLKKIKITYTKKNTSNHYIRSPYNITSANYMNNVICEKIIFDSYIDLGQGIYQCAQEILNKKLK